MLLNANIKPLLSHLLMGAGDSAYVWPNVDSNRSKDVAQNIKTDRFGQANLGGSPMM